MIRRVGSHGARVGRTDVRAFGSASAWARVALLALALAGARALLAQPAAKGSGEVASVARDVINRTMSPFCPGVLLANCPSRAADSLRRAIIARAEAGADRQRITAELVAVYGERVRSAPAARGFGLVAWLTPAVALLVAGAWIAVWLRRTAQRSSAARSAASTLPVDPRATPTDPGCDDAAAALRRLEALVRRDMTA